jgi:hypothetical protein
MPTRKRLLAALIAIAALGNPAAAVAKSAGDQQYVDPFQQSGGGGGKGGGGGGGVPWEVPVLGATALGLGAGTVVLLRRRARGA